MTAQQKAIEKIGKTDSSLIERLAHQLGITADAKRIYAEPIERGGATIIPVAKAFYGFGGGKKTGEADLGGGGVVILTPVGYIEIKSGATRFRPVRDPLAYAVLIAAVAPLAMFTVWCVTKMRRRRANDEKKK